MAAENKIKDAIKGLTDEEKKQVIREFTDEELLAELAARLTVRAKSLDAVMEAIGANKC